MNTKQITTSRKRELIPLSEAMKLLNDLNDALMEDIDELVDENESLRFGAEMLAQENEELRADVAALSAVINDYVAVTYD